MCSKLIKKIKDFFCPEKYDKKLIDKLELMPRHWGVLPILDRYIMREFLTKFSILMLVFIFAFIMGEALDSLGDFMRSKDATIVVTIKYFLLMLPGNLRFILPLVMLLGTIWTLATFGKNQEITAMRASGVSLLRCGSSILIFGIIMSCFNIYLNEFLIPMTDKYAVELKSNHTQEKITEARQILYRSSDGRRSWYLGRCINGTVYENVILKYYRDNGTLEYDLSAEKAEFVPNKGWCLANVVKTKYTEDGLLPYSPEKIDEIVFSQADVRETLKDMKMTTIDAEGLPSWIIWNMLATSKDLTESTKNTYWTLFFYRLVFPWSCLLAVFLGIPLATKGERSGIMLAIISAVGVIIGFMFVANFCLVLGKRGILPPFIAGVGPTFCFIMYGYYKVKNSQS